MPPAEDLPGLILLASATATIACAMARAMSGDADLAVAAISTIPLVSAATFWAHSGGSGASRPKPRIDTETLGPIERKTA